MTTLITGSSGHLGEALALTLRAAGEPVRAIDRLPSPHTDLVGDVADAGFVRGAMAGVTQVLRRRVPGWEAVYARHGWTPPATLDRVYDNRAARVGLGWQPRIDFAAALAWLEATGELLSPLARQVGKEGCHRGGWAH